MKAYALAHMGKATADTDFSMETPASAYTNPKIAPRLSAYTQRAREVHGSDYDPSSQNFDGRIVMEVGGGKKHGRYWMGDGTIDSASTPRLSEIRARASSGGDAIRPRQTVDQMKIASLQVIYVFFGLF